MELDLRVLMWLQTSDTAAACSLNQPLQPSTCRIRTEMVLELHMPEPPLALGMTPSIAEHFKGQLSSLRSNHSLHVQLANLRPKIAQSLMGLLGPRTDQQVMNK